MHINADLDNYISSCKSFWIVKVTLMVTNKTHTCMEKNKHISNSREGPLQIPVIRTIQLIFYSGA